MPTLSTARPRPGWPPRRGATGVRRGACPPVAAELHGLEVLAHDVGDNPSAVTRFVLVGRPGAVPEPTGADKTTLVAYQTDDHPGGLVEMLEQFAVRGVNLSRLESRPTGDALGQYCFSIDCDGPHRRGPRRRGADGAAPDLRAGDVPRVLPAATAPGPGRLGTATAAAARHHRGRLHRRARLDRDRSAAATLRPRERSGRGGHSGMRTVRARRSRLMSMARTSATTSPSTCTGCGVVDRDPQPPAAAVLDQAMPSTPTGQHPAGDGRPADHAVRRQGQRVQVAVVDQGIGHQRDAAADPPDVAGQHGPHPAADRRLARRSSA